MKRASLVLSVVVLAACSATKSPTEPVVHTGTVIATVVDAATHAGVANATVEVRRAADGSLAATAVTDAAGIADITLPAGTYSVNIKPPAGYVLNAQQVSGQFPLAAGATASVTALLSKL